MFTNEWIVYIIQCSDEKKSLYTGITNNLAKRLAAHNNGTGAKFTRGRGPVFLIKFFEVGDKSAALKLERKIKSLTKKQKLLFELI
jgi:putative endonuclease